MREAAVPPQPAIINDLAGLVFLLQERLKPVKRDEGTGNGGGIP